jgi:hypothetical protein
VARGHSSRGKKIYKVKFLRLYGSYDHLDETGDNPAARSAPKPFTKKKFPELPMFNIHQHH